MRPGSEGQPKISDGSAEERGGRLYRVLRSAYRFHSWDSTKKSNSW